MRRLDRTGKRERWANAQVVEKQYAVQLRGVARSIGDLVRGLAPNGELTRVDRLIQALVDYAEIVTPWAESVAERMTAEVLRRDKLMWKRNSQEMARQLRYQIESTPVGDILRDIQRDQVERIRSIPLEAAQRVQSLATAAITRSQRADVIAAHILATEDVSRAKANVIARTEVSTAQSNLVEARAVNAGSEGYIWRTSRDFDVRKSHQEMEGKYVRWSHPPTLDKLTGHAGCLPNCRCFAEPIFPDF